MTTNVTATRPRLAMQAASPKRPTRRTVTTIAPRRVDLAAALADWTRIAVPVADPGPCPVPWCIGCMWSGDAEDPRLHQSAGAIVEAFEFNGISSSRPKEASERVLKVAVERCDGGKGDEPAIVHVYLGRREGFDLGPAKARELTTALRKAQASARELLQRDGVQDGTAGAVSVVRVREYDVQVGAVFDDGTASVYVNYVRAYTAVELRDQVRHGLTSFVEPTETWDLLPGDAGRLADAVESAAQLADADRAAAAITAPSAPTCPWWCTQHFTDPDGSVCHEGKPVEIDVAGDEILVGGKVTLKLNRYDDRGRAAGQTAVCLQASQDGIDLSAAELLQVASAAQRLAAQTEATR